MPFNREVGNSVVYQAAKPENWQPGDYTKLNEAINNNKNFNNNYNNYNNAPQYQRNPYFLKLLLSFLLNFFALF